MLAVLAAVTLVASSHAPAAEPPTPAAHVARHGCRPRRSMRCREVRARRRCDQRHVRACILRAALHQRVSFRLMIAIAHCESGLRPTARNPASTAAGLFQWLDTSWAATPYAARSRFSAKWSALAAARALRTVGTSPWLASRHCWA